MHHSIWETRFRDQPFLCLSEVEVSIGVWCVTPSEQFPGQSQQITLQVKVKGRLTAFSTLGTPGLSKRRQERREAVNVFVLGDTRFRLLRSGAVHSEFPSISLRAGRIPSSLPLVALARCSGETAFDFIHPPNIRPASSNLTAASPYCPFESRRISCASRIRILNRFRASLANLRSGSRFFRYCAVVNCSSTSSAVTSIRSVSEWRNR